MRLNIKYLSKYFFDIKQIENKIAYTLILNIMDYKITEYNFVFEEL